MIPEVIEAARAAYKAGLSVVPPRTDGSKRPVGNWKDFQTTRASAEQMRQWFSGRATGLGAIMGAILLIGLERQLDIQDAQNRAWAREYLGE